MLNINHFYKKNSVTINIFKSEEEVLNNLAAFFVLTANAAIAAKGKFTVALSGGSSPKQLYELLAANYADKLNWHNVDFFFGDERYVPQDDAKSNYLMAKTALFTPLNILTTQVFAVNTNLEPNKAAEAYSLTINNYFKGNTIIFDLILLGLGDNSHTASLFPHTTILQEQTATVKAVFLKDEDVYRISFSAPLINNASKIAFLVYGAGKASAVHHVIEDEKNTDLYPAQLITPLIGELCWFLDKNAAANIKSSI